MTVKKINNKDYILCEWRRRYVRLTPEEWVRQNILHRLVEQYHFPKERIAVEMPLTGVSKNYRADAIVYGINLKPIMLIEFKADNVALTEKTLDQAIVYNRQLNVPYLILSNGRESVVAKVDGNHIEFLNQIPKWNQLSL